MNSNITIVSAFFDINRENWKGFSRSNEKYFEYFKGWAKLKNKLVVYVESEDLRNRILEFRASLGLADKTQVVFINNCLEIDPVLLESIRKAAHNNIHRKYRLFPNNPEVWNAEYDYIMLLKMWCVSDAVEKGLASDMVAWVDFGYNHGGDVIDINSNFNFLWKYDFPQKINLFLIQDIDERPLFDIVMSMDTYIMGMVIVGVDHLWGNFWTLMRESMIELNNCGMIDDDQNIILMCLRKKPEFFSTHKSSWQLPLKQFGGDHLLLRSKKEDLKIISFAKIIKHKFFIYKKSAELCWRVFRIMSSRTIH